MTVSDNDIAELMASELAARRNKVMFLRNGGVPWSKVAEECGVSETTVRRDYDLVCGEINAEPRDRTVARHRAVIFDIQRANYPAMMRGDKDAAATILRALERESKLLGYDSPTRLLAAVSNEDFANEAARLIVRIQELDADTLKELTHGHGDRKADIIEGEVMVDPPEHEPVARAAPDQPPPGDTGRPGVDPGLPALPDDDDDWSNID